MKEFWTEGLPKIFEQFDFTNRIVALFIVMFFIMLISLKGKMNAKSLKMLLGFIFILFLTILIFNVLKDNTKSNQQKSTFNEDFIDNRNDWNIGKRQRTTSKINNGYLYFSSNQNALYPLSILLNNLSVNQDIEISCKFRLINNSNDGYGGIEWGKDDKNNSIVAYLNNSKQLFIGLQRNSNNIDALINWEGNLNINKNDFNEILIRNKSNTAEFYINGSKIFTTEKLSLYGERVGFSVFNSEIVVDYLRVNKL